MTRQDYLRLLLDLGRCRRVRRWPRRTFLKLLLGFFVCRPLRSNADTEARCARVAITMDLEMSRDYPQRGMREWDYEKGNLDEATKRYAVRAAHVVQQYGGKIHFFLVGRVLEQPDVDWLKELIKNGHPIGNHTYDHVNLMARSLEELQYRFQRAPWLIRGRSVEEVIRQNIEMTTDAMHTRLGIIPSGFRTPGGFADGLRHRPDLRAMLRELGFRWCSSLYPAHRMTQPGQAPDEEYWKNLPAAWLQAQPFRYEDGLVEVPMSPVSDVTAFRSQRWSLPLFLKVTRLALEWTIREQGVFDFLCHPSCLVVEDPQCEVLHTICQTVKSAGEKATLVSLDQIANQT
jgi:peptidoglycan/xylan/chitin deacetylase (PgdA/CDA1 family)